MLERLLIAGSGGQGIVFIGRLLATAAVQEVPHVTFFPSYGAEVRGGASKCQVVLSSREIASPVTEEMDSILVMNQESADRYLTDGRGDCLVVLNRSLCRASAVPDAVAVPATEWADEIGDTRAANLIMLGAYLARKPVVKVATLETCMAAALGGKNGSLLELNLRAFRKGLAAE
jgi:2-oxoglutarate ferredoxin oxidoreductase subunit gamma